MRSLALASLLLACVACDEAAPAPAAGSAPAETAPPETVGPIEAETVRARVADARRRLTDSEAGSLVWQAIEAHGGLERWLAAGTLAFEFDYAPIGREAHRKHTRNQVDLWSARARQEEIGEGADAVLGWDGERAWITPDIPSFAAPARFWALTPYYFVGIPFVMGDPGTRFERLPDAELEGVMHRLVKVTYEPGTGDSPDDYYILYIHPETHRIGALRYIVAYPGFFPNGGHSPEKLMVYSEQREVNGLVFAHRYDTYGWDDEDGRGERVTDVTARDIRLGETWPASIFDPPEGAVVLDSIAQHVD